MKTPPDPGFKDPDNSAGFDVLVATLDHFSHASYVRAARRILYRLLRPRPGVRLLDAGCGTGLDAAALTPRVQPGGRVVALDTSERMLDIARRRCAGLEGIEFRRSALPETGLPADAFDAAWSMRTLRYLDDPLAGVVELARVTRPGGRVIAIEGALSAVDLPDSPLRRHVFGPTTEPSLGLRLPGLFRAAGLNRVRVHSAFGYELGTPDPAILDYARAQAGAAVDEGLVTASEAEEWLQSLDAVVAAKSWFSADCFFVVSGRSALADR